MDTIKLEKKEVIRAYRNANEEGKKLLESVFGAEIFKLAVQERIKTLKDACDELGEKHPLVQKWKKFCEAEIEDKDTNAYIRLRIIVAALNEGWKPQFTEDEWRYFPYFVFYTQEEIDKMSEETRASVVLRSDGGADAYGGVDCAYAGSDSSNMSDGNGSRLALRSNKLAEYAGKQFIDIYADFVWR